MKAIYEMEDSFEAEVFLCDPDCLSSPASESHDITLYLLVVKSVAQPACG